jgi:hypothetical protein
VIGAASGVGRRSGRGGGGAPGGEDGAVGAASGAGRRRWNGQDDVGCREGAWLRCPVEEAWREAEAQREAEE